MTIDKIKFLIENISDEDMHFILVSLLSSDTLLSKENCEKSLEMTNKIIKALSEADISELKRTRWLEYAKESKEIISRDLKEFKNGK